MATNSFYQAMLDATDYSYLNGAVLPIGYQLDATFDGDGIYQDPDTGFQVIAMVSNDGTERILAFTGTEGIQDWFADTKLGWEQWEVQKNQDAVMDYLQSLSSIPGITNIHFTGHSLGGALAQYAAYVYVASIRTPTNETATLPIPVTLTTFNALGGVDGLTQYLPGVDPFRPIVMAGIQNAHFYMADDLVSQLGGSHLGGNTLRWDNPFVPGTAINFVDAHLMSTLKVAANVNGFDGAVALPPVYLNIPNIQQTAANFGRLFNGLESDTRESAYRIVTGVVGTFAIIAASGYTSAMRAELNSLARDIFQNLSDSATDPEAQQTYLKYASTDWDYVLTKIGAAPLSTISGLALMLGGLNDLLGIAADFVNIPEPIQTALSDHVTNVIMETIDAFVTLWSISPLDIIRQGLFGDTSALPTVIASDLAVAEGDTGQLLLNFVSPVPAGGYTFMLKVRHPDRVTLSGTGISLLGDPSLGRYQLVVAEGETTANVDVSALGDSDVINDYTFVSVYLTPYQDLDDVFRDGLRRTVFIDITDTTVITPEGYLLTNGTNDPDTLTGTAGQDEMHGFGDDDDLNGDAGDDLLYGDAGDDLLVGGSGADGLYGEAGRDMLHAGDGRDVLYGEDGNDFLSGQDGDDLISGDDGDDLLSGGSGSDLLFGEACQDTLCRGLRALPLYEMNTKMGTADPRLRTAA
jgi:hypothetical protein